MPLPGALYPPGQCPLCGYDLAGLTPEVTKCPECGDPINWDLVRRAPPVVRSRGGAVALILAPHVCAAILGFVASLSSRMFPILETSGLIVLLVIVYLVSAVFCAIDGCFTMMGRPDSAWSRLLAAAGGLALSIGLALLTLGAVEMILPSM